MSQPKSIFCDIDGTLVEHKGDIIKNYQDNPVGLTNVIQSIKQWDKLNYRIILTTGRKESTRYHTEQQLHSMGIVYDQLIMGLPNGDRVLINDKKTNGIRNTAYAINLVRNEGMEHVDLTSDNVTIPNSYIYTKINKPWGYEELVECNDKYVVKKLFMIKGNACSIQYHKQKTETIVILNGKMTIYTGKCLEDMTRQVYLPGETLTIKPYTVHRMEADTEDCLYLETSTNELWDVVRLKDNYNRLE